MVAGGHRQHRDDSIETSSPTVSITSVFLVAIIAAYNRWGIVTMDITGAYLNAPLHDPVYMRLDPYLSNILCEISKSYQPYVNQRGEIVVRLRRALYGLIQSSRLWYNHLKDILTSYGFVMNNEDRCVFKLVREKSVMIICLSEFSVFFLEISNEAHLSFTALS